MTKRNFAHPNIIWLILLLNSFVLAQTSRTISGTVITTKNELVPNVQVFADTLEIKTDEKGRFSLKIPTSISQLRIEGKNIIAKKLSIQTGSK